MKDVPVIENTDFATVLNNVPPPSRASGAGAGGVNLTFRFYSWVLEFDEVVMRLDSSDSSMAMFPCRSLVFPCLSPVFPR